MKSAVLVYIAMVGFIYSLLLRHLWTPAGAQLIADRLLHDVLPPLYLLYWIAFVPKGALRWIDPVYWLCFPAPIFSTFFCGACLSESYPYSFLDVAALGYSPASW